MAADSITCKEDGIRVRAKENIVPPYTSPTQSGRMRVSGIEQCAASRATLTYDMRPPWTRSPDVPTRTGQSQMSAYGRR